MVREINTSGALSSFLNGSHIALDHSPTNQFRVNKEDICDEPNSMSQAARSTEKDKF